MDDLYGNAWGESANPELEHATFAPPWKASPSQTTKSTHEETEPKIKWVPAAAPVSWSSDVDVIPKSSSLWTRSPALDVWGASPQHTPIRSPSPASRPHSPSTPSSPNLSDSTAEEQYTTNSDVPIPASPLARSRSPSPDAFGTFESGDQDSLPPHAEDDGWGPTPPVYDTPDVGSSPWVLDAPNKSAVQKVEDDEWETAKRQKEQLDKKVPPEVFTNIIDKFNTFIQETWPDLENMPPDEDWMKGWRSGLDSVEGLDKIVNTIIPEHNFSPRVPFGKTSIAKDMSKSLRLSRGLPLSRMSPMSHFMLSRGSSSDWETAVKNRSDVIPDDMPVGWRIVEKKEDPLPAVDPRAKKAGIFSFWGRKGSTSNPATHAAEQKQLQILDSIDNAVASPSPLPIAAAPITKPVSESPGQSAEVHRSMSTPDRLPTPSLMPPSAIPPTRLQTEPSTSDPVDLCASEPAPSAVSRFLNRFSRPKNSISPRNSTALSSDDLDFLSDSVSSAVNDPDEDDVPLAQQKATINRGSGVLLPTLPPPPPPMMAPSASDTDQMSKLSTDDVDFSSFFDTPVPEASYSNSEPTKVSSAPQMDDRLFSTIGVPITRKPDLSVRKGVRPSASPSPVDKDRNPLASLIHPSPPSSRSQTPPHFPLAKMSSSTNRSTSVPFLIPPPPSSRSTTPALSSPSTHPAAVSKVSPMRLMTHPTNPSKSLAGIFNDDEFSDFLSSSDASARPSQSDLTHTMDPQYVQTSVADKHPLMASTSFLGSSKSTSFDDFNDFVTSPPQVIQSSPPPPPPPAKPKSFRPPTISTPNSQPGRTANHSRTLSLLESAVTRKGQWPAPPSPLPGVLDPPPLPAARSNTTIALLDMDDEHPSTTNESLLQRSVISPLGPSGIGSGFKSMNPPVGFGANSMSPLPLLQKPPSSSQPSHSLMDFVDMESSSSTMPAVQAKAQPVNTMPSSGNGRLGGGGLSAQDLSFFEGL